MRLEPVSLAPGSVDGVRQPADDGNKTARLPRWTRQEILVLIQGKRLAEKRATRGRGLGSGQTEPKWVSVSSYCKKHGMNRGPIQCRKRWSNLAGDFRKIKEWESKITEETESFWVMRNDLRRERKLPVFFDKDVYDILEGGGGGDGDGEEEEDAGGGLDLSLAPAAAVRMAEETEAEVLFDSGRSAGADEGLFSDFEQSGQDCAGQRDEEISVKYIPAPVPISEKQQYQSFPQESSRQGADHEKQPAAASEEETEEEVPRAPQQEKRKRKRNGILDEEEEESRNLEQQHRHRLIETLERNGKLLSSQIEAQNTHLHLDREQSNNQANSLITVLNKLADALGRIADKL